MIYLYLFGMLSTFVFLIVLFEVIDDLADGNLLLWGTIFWPSTLLVAFGIGLGKLIKFLLKR